MALLSAARQAILPRWKGTPTVSYTHLANTGYEELSLSSLSTSDHGQLEQLLDDLNEWAPKEHVSLCLLYTSRCV